jgi:hypothetical protein
VVRLADSEPLAPAFSKLRQRETESAAAAVT